MVRCATAQLRYRGYRPQPVRSGKALIIQAAAIPGRSRLYVPDDFEERLVRFETSELLLKSSAVLERVRADANDEVRPVIALMDRFGNALERAVLLVPMMNKDVMTGPSR